MFDNTWPSAFWPCGPGSTVSAVDFRNNSVHPRFQRPCGRGSTIDEEGKMFELGQEKWRVPSVDLVMSGSWLCLSCGERFHPNATDHLRQPSQATEVHRQQITPSCCAATACKNECESLVARRRQPLNTLLRQPAPSFVCPGRIVPRRSDSRCNTKRLASTAAKK